MFRCDAFKSFRVACQILHRSVIMTCRYGDDPPEGAGEAGGAVGGADSPPASFMAHASSPGMNQAFEDLASLGVELREDAAEEPADGEFFEIIRELYDESDGKTKKQAIPSKCLNIVN